MSTTDLREGYAELDDVRLHYVEAGEGPLLRRAMTGTFQTCLGALMQDVA